jgi:hypothetical protein
VSIPLSECLRLSEGGAIRVDRDKGIIYNVKVLGWKSANGREYLPSSVTTALYEGRRVRCGHAPEGKDRDPRDTYAVLEGASIKEAGVYAERLRLLNPKGEFEQRLLSAAESAPHLFGLSHTARGRERQGSGGRVIEAVESVDSVDLVDDPATVRGFYESRAHPVKIKDLIEALKAKRPLYAKGLREAVEAGIASPDTMMDSPPGEAEPADHEAALKAGFRAAIVAALDDESMDMKAKLAKIKEIMKAEEKMIGGGKEPPSGPSEPSEPSETEESRKGKADANLREENERLKAEKLVRKAASEARVPLTEALVEGLARPGMTEAQAKAIVSELRGVQGERPRSAGPTLPAGAPAGADLKESKLPDNADAKVVGRWLNGR